MNHYHLPTVSKPGPFGVDPVPFSHKSHKTPTQMAEDAARAARDEALRALYAPTFAIKRDWGEFCAKFATAPAAERFAIARDAELAMLKFAERVGGVEQYLVAHEADRLAAQRASTATVA